MYDGYERAMNAFMIVIFWFVILIIYMIFYYGHNKELLV